MIALHRVRFDASGPEGPTTLLHETTCSLTAPRTAVIGENGSGKTTLARVIGGLAKPTAGMVSAPERIGMLFSNPSAQPIMPTVREDVALSLRGSGLSRGEIASRVEAALTRHDLLELADRACHSLSSGQQQRLALCAILIAEPDLVVADEPTSLLDLRHRRIVADRLLEPAAKQLVLVTHDLDLAARCDEAVLVVAGRIAAQGRPAEVIARYEDSLA